jgi:hypothetical protein
VQIVLTARFEVSDRQLDREEAESRVRKAAQRLLKPMPSYANLVGVEASSFDPVNVNISYEPQAIRDHFESDDDDEVQDLLESVTDAQLYDTASDFLQGDAVYKDFHANCMEILRSAAGAEDEEA